MRSDRAGVVSLIMLLLIVILIIYVVGLDTFIGWILESINALTGVRQ